MKIKIQNILLFKEFIMDATVKTIFDEMINQVSQNMMDEKFDETCDKINNLARDLWFNHKALTFEEMTDIKHKVFEIKSKRTNIEFENECTRMDEEFKMECARMHKEFKDSTASNKSSSNNGWWIEQNRLNDMMNQQMIQNTIIQNQIINSMM